MIRLRHGATLVRGTGFPPDRQGLTEGELPFFKVGDFNRPGNETYLSACDNWISQATTLELRARPVPADTVLFPKIGAALLLGARRITTMPSVFDNNVLGVVPITLDPRYLRYWLSTVDLAPLANPGPVPSLDDDALRDLHVPVTARDEQLAIADYLDVETARIDALVAARRRTAVLAVMRLDAATRQAVSIGPDGKLHPQVPLRRRWQIIDCKHRTPEYLSDGYPIVSPGDATPGRLDLSRCSRFVGQADFDDLTEGVRRPRRGDIIYTRNASIGIAAYVATDEPFSMGQDVCVIRSHDQDQRFLAYALNTLGMDQLEAQKIGSTFSRINVARVLDLVVPCPPAATQRRIADALDEATSLTRELVKATQRHVDLMLERRQALITSAVTGQLGIPGIAA